MHWPILREGCPWFTYVEHPLEWCLQKIYGTLLSSSGTTSLSLKQLGACTEHKHRVKMKCTVNAYRPDVIKGFEYYPRVDVVLSGPCGYIAIAVEVNQAECKWWISVPQVLTINMTFTEFYLPIVSPLCGFDRLSIESLDGAYKQNYCGRRDPFTIIPKRPQAEHRVLPFFAINGRS